MSLVFRDDGNIDRAQELAAEAIRLAQTSNIKNVATHGLIDVGLALNRGDFDEAGKYIKQALDMARQEKARAVRRGRFCRWAGSINSWAITTKPSLSFRKH